MITIVPSTEVSLRHRATFVAVAEAGHIVAMSQNGLGTLLVPGAITGSQFQVPHSVSCISISPSGSVIAICVNARLLLLSTENFRRIRRLDDAMDCRFTASGDLWSALISDDSSFLLEIREPNTWQVVARAEVKDPLGDMACLLFLHPDGEHVAIWAAAGQNGQSIFWARRDGSNIIVDHFPDLYEAAPPSFRDSEFLVPCNFNELRRYQFPFGPMRGKMIWPFDGTGDHIGDFVSFVDSGLALLNSSYENRLYLVDLEKMSIIDEVSIRGYDERDIRPGWIYSLPTGDFLSTHGAGNGGGRLLTWRFPQG